MDDADFMLGLKNDPDTRRFAILTQDEIKREDHIRWLENNVHEFQIIESDFGSSKGAIRMHENEISIWLGKEFRGQGIALKMINSVKRRGTIAKIVSGNIASMRAFSKARFLPKEYVDNKYYIYEFLS